MGIEIIGVIGTFAFLWAFYEASSGKWRATSYRYELISLLCAICLVVYALHKDAYASIFLNTFYAVLCVLAIKKTHMRYSTKRKKRKRITKK